MSSVVNSPKKMTRAKLSCVAVCLLFLQSISGDEESTSTTVLDKDYSDATIHGLSRSQTNVPPNSPIRLEPSQSSIERQQGSAMLVTCYSDRGTQTTWVNTKGQQVVSPKGRIHVELTQLTGHSLVFEDINSGDRGNYTCKTVVDGKEFKKAFELTVVVPTSFNKTPEIQEAELGQNMTLRCFARGDPTPSIMWRFNGRPLDGAEKYRFLEQGLLIYNVSLSDSGEYVCRALQLSSSVSTLKEFRITALIQHKPMFEMLEGANEVIHGYMSGAVNLTCHASGEPKPQLEWFKDKKPVTEDEHISVLEDDNNSTLQLLLNDKTLYGNYTCRATNKLGSSEKLFRLEEGDRPEPPEEFKLSHVTSDSVQLKIVPPENGLLPITAFRVQYVPKQGENATWEDVKITDFVIDDDETYILQGLSQDTDYVIRVQTRNAAGYSVHSEEEEIHTQKIQADSITESSAVTTTLSVLFIISVHYLM